MKNIRFQLFIYIFISITFCVNLTGQDTTVNKWIKLKSINNDHWGNPIVWCPDKKKLLHYTGFDIKSFNLEKQEWEKEYSWPGEKGFGLTGIDSNTKGVTFTGTGVMTPLGFPCPALTSNGLTWDTKRKNLILVMHGLMATYDPFTKKWSEIKCETELYGKKATGAPKVYGQGICYDPINDELVMFPHWGGKNTDLKEITGELSSHYGTFIYSFKENLWSRSIDKFAPPNIIEVRQNILKICSKLNEVTEIIFAIRGKSENNQLPITDPLLKTIISEIIGADKSDLIDLDKILISAKTINEYLNNKNYDEALKISTQVLRDLRNILESEILVIQPPPRCGTSMIYDPDLKSIIMFGGQGALRRSDLKNPDNKGGLPGSYNDTWIYDCTNHRWHQLKCNNRPPETIWPQIIRDPISKKIILVTISSNWGGEKGKIQIWSLDPTNGEWKDCGVQDAPEDRIPRTNWTGWGNSTFALGYDEEAKQLLIVGETGEYHKLKPTTFSMNLDVSKLESKLASTWEKRLPIKPMILPVDDPAWVKKMKDIKPNEWFSTGESSSQPNRDWGNIECDPITGNVYFFGGGHSTYQGRDVAIYVVGANKWIFNAGGHNDHTPPIGWEGIHMDFYGAPPAAHQRNSYVALDGRMYKGIGASTMRKQYADSGMANKGPRFSYFFDVNRGGIWRQTEISKVIWGKGIPGTYGDVHMATRDGRILGFGGELEPYNGRDCNGSVTFASLNIYSNELTVNLIEKPHPSWVGECRPFCFISDLGKSGSVFFYEFRNDGGQGTWIYDIQENKFNKLNPSKEPKGLPNTVVYIPDQKAVFAIINNEHQWIYSFEKQTWGEMPLKGSGEVQFMRPYAQTVYSEKYGVLVNLPNTKIMRPNFSEINFK
jgi:hypothetical protein